MIFSSIRTPHFAAAVTAAILLLGAPAQAAEPVTLPASTASISSSVMVPLNRSALVTTAAPMAEVMIANPDIADVHTHNLSTLTIVGKKLGRTNVRVFDKQGNLIRELEITVGYDLPAMRRALKTFLPDEVIGVEMVNNSVALTGQVSNATVVDKAMQIAGEFVHSQSAGRPAPSAADSAVSTLMAISQPGSPSQPAASATPAASSGDGTVLNMLQVTSGQQVMLRVRVGEIQRSALKTLGIDLNAIARGASNTGAFLGTGGGIASLVAPTGDADPINPGVFLLPGGQTPTNTQGVFALRWQPDGVGGNTYAGLLKALEQDGLFKVLAEPNLVAISGEEAEFLSGGEIPIPVVGNGSGNNTNVTIEYKPFGVAVKFTPFVLTESRIRMIVQPEVSQISSSNAIQISGFSIPSIDTRRARTTVELAPGESFMIAGLINDQTRSTINQLPGVKELPVLGALFRSTEFQRNETELVIAVTPYVVDPVKSSDVKLPTDNFRPASQMEMFFYGALGSMSGDSRRISQTPSMLEGPIGFMVD